LGISAIWITPIYPSPGFDTGYDISDYRGIDKNMGTMEDFEELTNKLHENGLLNIYLYVIFKNYFKTHDCVALILNLNL